MRGMTMMSVTKKAILCGMCAALLALPAAGGAQETGIRAGGPEGHGCDEYWYLPAAPGVNLFVHEAGEGEPVVVLHGGPGADHSYMHGVARELTGQFRFIFYDQRGSLRSTERDGVTYTIQDHVADLEALRMALGAERIRVLSHSAGTTLAYHYLERHPDRVANLTLVGAVHPVNGAPGAKIYDDEDREFFAQRPGLMEDFQNRPSVQRAIRQAGLESPTTPRDSARLAVLRQFAADVYHVERWKGHIPLRINPEVARETQGSIDWNYDRTALLDAHDHPITVINGEFDYVVGLRGSPIWKKLAREHMPDVEVIVIPAAGHSPWVDQPVAFAVAVACALSC